MTDDTQIWEQIDRYLTGDMDATELKSFKATLASDVELANMVEASQIANEVVIGHEVLKLKVQMGKDMAKPKNSGLNLGIAILLLTATVAGGAYWITNKEPQSPVSKSTVVNPAPTKPTNDHYTKTDRPIDSLANKTVASNSAASTVKSIVPKRKEDHVSDVVSEDANPTKETQKQNSPTDIPKKEGITTADKGLQNTDKEAIPTVQQKDLCEGSIQLSLQTSPTCADEHTGSIHIKTGSITGGQAPYQFSIFSNKEFGTGTITGLQAGTYTIYVKDANACSYTYSHQAVVTQIVCKSPQKEYTYHLAYDPAWKIPYDSQKNAKSFKILNKSGKEVYHSQIHNGSPEEWNGESNTGLNISVGYHVYLIEYTDNTIEQGSIIIIK